MSVYVIGAVLGVVLQHKDRGVVPVSAVRNGIDYAAKGQVVVGHRCGRAWQIGARASGVIVRQIQEDE